MFSVQVNRKTTPVPDTPMSSAGPLELYRSPFSTRSSPPVLSPGTPSSPSLLSPEASDNAFEVDNMSVASSASSTVRKFKIPDTWRPSIMHCIAQETEEAQRQALVSKIRNEIVRDLVSQMFSFNPRPQKEFCEQVAQLLVKKYKFMRDVGQKVSGHVSCSIIIKSVHMHGL